jgi:HlyD family secretion protein
VTFSVDAHPGESFRGTVGKVRLNASMTQNVVTYTVEVAADNADNRLLPYLTANVRFEVRRRDQVLQVPNAALRWTPTAELIAAGVEPAAQPAARPLAAAAGGGDTPAGAATRPAVLWLADGARVRPLAVRVGLADAAVTEVEGDGLSAGLAVVTGVDAAASAAAGATKNPFTPTLPKPPGGGPPPR